MKKFIPLRERLAYPCLCIILLAPYPACALSCSHLPCLFIIILLCGLPRSRLTLLANYPTLCFSLLAHYPVCALPYLRSVMPIPYPLVYYLACTLPCLRFALLVPHLACAFPCSHLILHMAYPPRTSCVSSCCRALPC